MDKQFQPVTGGNKSMLLKSPAAACCGPAQKIDDSIFRQDFVTGTFINEQVTFPVAATLLTRKDRWNHVKARTGSFRNNFTVVPGLYAVGNPSSNSDVFVSANYGMSFNYLREALHGMNAWILVLDTKGINVWCAAGKGTFGTAEVVNRIRLSGVEKVVKHRKIIVPQLGAPGVDAAEVQKQTGFRVMYGPVLAKDIKAYVAAGYKATGEMRIIKFGVIDRLVLTPMEINPAMKKYPQFALAVLVIFGLTPEGIIFKNAFYDGMPFLLGGLFAVLTGAFMTPMLLPFVPFRSFALKGLLTGLAVFVPLSFSMADVFQNSELTQLAFVLLFTAFTSYFAVQFTGATTFTHLSGVKKELKYALPIYIVTAVLSAFLILYDRVGGMI